MTWTQLKVKFLMGIAIFFMGAYPIYTNLQYGLAYLQYDRHQNWLRGESDFFNPWQYRVFCPLVIEGCYQVYTYTIDRVIPVEKIFPNKKPDVLRYYIIFISFRFALHVLIFWLCIRFYQYFIKNKWLIYFGLGLLVLSMGNAVYDSDFSFNNYVNVVLYLWMGIIIIEHKSPWWLIPIMTIGALNRETSLLIPVIYWFVVAFKINKLQKPDNKVNLATFLSLVSFTFLFWSIRQYFGYQEPILYNPLEGLPLNLVTSQGYLEIFGLTSICSFWTLLHWGKGSRILKIIFIALIPIWFLVHFSVAAIWESRLFLVPMVLLFLPMTLETLEKSYFHQALNTTDQPPNNK